MQTQAEIGWTFGTTDVYGFKRTHPLPAGVWGEVGYDGWDVFRRVESGDHGTANLIEVGERAAFALLREEPDCQCEVCRPA